MHIVQLFFQGSSPGKGRVRVVEASGVFLEHKISATLLCQLTFFPESLRLIEYAGLLRGCSSWGGLHAVCLHRVTSPHSRSLSEIESLLAL